jgi:hypothetical protein
MLIKFVVYCRPSKYATKIELRVLLCLVWQSHDSSVWENSKACIDFKHVRTAELLWHNVWVQWSVCCWGWPVPVTWDKCHSVFFRQKEIPQWSIRKLMGETQCTRSLHQTRVHSTTQQLDRFKRVQTEETTGGWSLGIWWETAYVF